MKLYMFVPNVTELYISKYLNTSLGNIDISVKKDRNTIIKSNHKSKMFCKLTINISNQTNNSSFTLTRLAFLLFACQK
jgi:hypothetical protein